MRVSAPNGYAAISDVRFENIHGERGDFGSFRRARPLVNDLADELCFDTVALCCCSVVGNSSKYGIAGVTFANVTLAGRKLSAATAKEDGMEISQARGVVFQ